MIKDINRQFSKQEDKKMTLGTKRAATQMQTKGSVGASDCPKGWKPQLFTRN